MVWFLYNILFSVGFLLMLPHFFKRMKRRGGYWRDFGQRLSWYDPSLKARLKEGGRIWVHAVSVGELFVAFRFMDEVRARRPGAKFVLTTTTSTGHALAENRLMRPDILLYFPVDFPVIMKRVLRLIAPKALVLIECELWPNLIRLAKRQGVPVMLINGRISDHSYRGYRKLRAFTRRLLPMVDLLCVQSEADRRRLLELGARPEPMHLLSSAKYDMVPPGADGREKAQAVLKAIGVLDDQVILLGGSTWPGEEAVLLDIYTELRKAPPDLMLVLVPRHFERSPEVVREMEKRGLKFVRRTEIGEGMPPAGKPDVLLIDTTGELMNFYACATVIFVGKSLFEHGGQNVIEPAIYGKAIVVGPNMENFSVVMEDFLSENALVQVPDAAGLKKAIEELVANPTQRIAMGERAGRVVQAKAGAVAKTVDLAQEYLLK